MVSKLTISTLFTMLSKVVFQHSLTVLFSLSVIVAQLGLEGETPIFIQIYYIELLKTRSTALLTNKEYYLQCYCINKFLFKVLFI